LQNAPTQHSLKAIDFQKPTPFPSRKEGASRKSGASRTGEGGLSPYDAV